MDHTPPLDGTPAGIMFVFMGRSNEVPSAELESGLNTEVQHGGSHYHVQTQCSTRGAPVIESLVFQDGQTLVRITAAYDDIAERFGFNGDDGRHLLELQHTDLIGKIRHGMLDDDDPTVSVPATAEPTRVTDASGAIVDFNDIHEPAVRALLAELGANVDAASAVDATSVPSATIQRRPWWRRLAICIRFPSH